MSSPHDQPACTEVDRLLAQIDRLDDKAFQRLLPGVLKSYVERHTRSEHGLPPFERDALTPTETVVCANEILEASGLELVDLSVWHGLGTR